MGDNDHTLWETARATAAQLSDSQLYQQIEAVNCLAAALRQEARARRDAARLQTGDVGERLAAVKAYLDSLPSA